MAVNARTGVSQRGQRLPYGRNFPQIACKDEEEEKGQKQSHVNMAEKLSVKEKQDGQHHAGQQWNGEKMEYRQQAEKKQREIKRQPPFIPDLRHFQEPYLDVLVGETKTAGRQQADEA